MGQRDPSEGQQGFLTSRHDQCQTDPAIFLHFSSICVLSLHYRDGLLG